MVQWNIDLKYARGLSLLKNRISKNMCLKFVFIKKKIINSRGETMIEVITSLALFAITLVTVATLFSAANRVFVKNIAIENQLNAQINKLAMEIELESASILPEIVFKYTPVNEIVEKQIQKKIELIYPDLKQGGSSLAKFREVTETEVGP